MSENNSPDTYDTSYDTDVYGYGEPMVGPLDAPEKPSGWHPVNITHLVMGVAFAGMVLVWALVQADVVATDGLRWLMPACWSATGSVPSTPGPASCSATTR